MGGIAPSFTNFSIGSLLFNKISAFIGIIIWYGMYSTSFLAQSAKIDLAWAAFDLLGLYVFMLWYFGKDAFQPWIISCAIILPILDYRRRHNKFLHRIYSDLFIRFTRPIEQGILSGASWVIIGAAITIFIFNEIL